jgi:hypothetical protein
MLDAHRRRAHDEVHRERRHLGVFGELVRRIDGDDPGELIFALPAVDVVIGGGGADGAAFDQDLHRRHAPRRVGRLHRAHRRLILIARRAPARGAFDEDQLRRLAHGGERDRLDRQRRVVDRVRRLFAEERKVRDRRPLTVAVRPRRIVAARRRRAIGRRIGRRAAADHHEPDDRDSNEAQAGPPPSITRPRAVVVKAAGLR